MSSIMNNNLLKKIGEINTIPLRIMDALIANDGDYNAMNKISKRYGIHVENLLAELLDIFEKSLPSKEERILTENQVLRYAEEVYEKVNPKILPIVETALEAHILNHLVRRNVQYYRDPWAPGARLTPSHFQIVPDLSDVHGNLELIYGTSEEEVENPQLQPGWLEGDGFKAGSGLGQYPVEKVYCEVENSYTDTKDMQIVKTLNGRWKLIGRCVNCGQRKHRYVKVEADEDVFGEGVKNENYARLNAIPKVTGSVLDQLKDNYLGDPKEGVGATITNMVGDVAAEVADKYVPGSGEVVKFAFGGLANAIQAALNEKDRANIIKSMLAAKKMSLDMVNNAKISEADKVKARSYITQMYSDVNADVADLRARLRDLLVGKGDVKKAEEEAAHNATLTPAIVAFNEAIKTDPFPQRGNAGPSDKKYLDEVQAWYQRHPNARTGGMIPKKQPAVPPLPVVGKKNPPKIPPQGAPGDFVPPPWVNVPIIPLILPPFAGNKLPIGDPDNMILPDPVPARTPRHS